MQAVRDSTGDSPSLETNTRGKQAAEDTGKRTQVEQRPKGGGKKVTKKSLREIALQKLEVHILHRHGDVFSIERKEGEAIVGFFFAKIRRKAEK